MKLGDKVKSTKIRPGDVATITKVDIRVKGKSTDNSVKKECRSSYEAEYEDKSKLIFYGFDIGRSVFRVEENDGQLTIEQWLQGIDSPQTSFQ